MSKELYRIGDLVKHTLGYNNGVSIDIYAKIENIIDKNESYYEYYVITGMGDLNSKVELTIRPIAYCKDLSNCNLDLIRLDPHNVYKRDINNMREEIKKKMDFLERKLEFVNKHENRIDKLNKILEK